MAQPTRYFPKLVRTFEARFETFLFMKLFRSFALVLGVGLAVAGLRATTVIPPTFDQLVSQAEFIFQGTVTGTNPQWAGEGGERHIVTYVTFKIEDPIKGALGDTYTVRMFGGTVDGHTMEATDTPRFKVGDRDILFVENNGKQFVPLVGIMHGRFRVQEQGNGRETIAKDNGAPMANVTKLGQDENAATSGKALSTADFKAAIRQKLAQTAAVK
ncbi:MAG: hypothetical protein V7609_2636 [Verrucomicrobiota bacterium]